MRKHRIAPACIVVCAGFVIASSATAGDPVSPANRAAVIARARALIEKGEGKGAIDLLEPLCLDATKDEKPKITESLLTAYRIEITRALTEGRKRDAEDLKKLESILSRPQKGRPSPIDAARGSTEPAEAQAAPERRSAESAKTDQSAAGEPRRTATADPETRLASTDAIPDALLEQPAAKPKAQPRSAPRIEEVTEDEVNAMRRERARKDEPRVQVMDAEPADAVAKTIDRSPNVNSVQPPPESRPKPSLPPEVTEADRALEAQDYKRAGMLYDRMYTGKRLPANRVDQWGYCRLRAIVERINAKPQSTSEWNAIRDEVELVRSKAGPSLKWPLKYVDDVIAERSSPQSSAKRPAKRKLRGQSPEPPRSASRSKPAAPAASAEPDRSPSASATAGEKPSDSAAGAASDIAGRDSGRLGPWRVRTTKNFRILHSNPELARKIAIVAEQTRTAQSKRWVDEKTADSTWSPICDIFVYPDLESYTEATGQTESSPGFSTVGQQDGRIVDRRINLHADNAKLLSAVLPHEVTHIVIADAFPDRPIPLWADEGIALLSEPEAEQRTRSAVPEADLRAGRRYRLHDLMNMEYPSGEHWYLFFAQSATLTRYLVERSSPRDFVRYLKTSAVTGYEKPLKPTFGIADFAELERRVGEYARGERVAKGAEKTEKR